MQKNRENLFLGLVATVGLALGFAGISWIVGSFGVSTATATAIVKAVEVGSWGMFLVAIAATGGIIGAGMWGAIKLMIWRVGSKAAIA